MGDNEKDTTKPWLYISGNRLSPCISLAKSMEHTVPDKEYRNQIGKVISESLSISNPSSLSGQSLNNNISEILNLSNGTTNSQSFNGQGLQNNVSESFTITNS